VVQKSGSHFSFEDERLGQGRQNATAFLREHPDVSNQILERLQALAGPDQVISARLLAATAAEQADGRPALEAVPTPDAEEASAEVETEPVEAPKEVASKA
jgi:recombination protein RecA